MSAIADWDLSTAELELALRAAGGLALARYGLAGQAWGLPSSGLFAVEVDGRRIDARTPGLELLSVAEQPSAPGRRHLLAQLAHAEAGVTIDYHLAAYADTALIESWLVVRNSGAGLRRVTRLDSLALDLPADAYRLLSFTGDWGDEFRPHAAELAGDVLLESRSGRASKGNHPWLALSRAGGQLSASVAWSGNWALRLARRADGGHTLTGGLHDWEFFSDLAPGAAIEAPPVALALAPGDDLSALSAQFALVGRRHWYPRSALAARMPVEWNHWWSYEDKTLNEQVFRENVDVAARLGIEVCALDAGWFGPTDPSTHWYDYRGDWDQVNTTRFPSGIRALSDYVHARGMAFGLWCEIEAVGRYARLGQARPDIVATRDGAPLGYVCLGSPAGQEWAFATLDRLIGEYGCDWIKLDFNLDPGAGCDRSDHGHGPGDGLYAHYRGYYQLLERVRARYPDVVLENCSSGGLRIDLGIARQTHMAFLSDPDWPEHSLQVFWGASQMLAPDAILHWGYCEWGFAEHPHQRFSPGDPALQPHQIDYYTRISMLRRFGFSQRLPNLPGWVAEQYAAHIADYQRDVRRFVAEAELLHLSGQPQRERQGDRWAAFQYRMPAGDEHLLAIFRLPGGEERRSFAPRGLSPQRSYRVVYLGEQREELRSGAELIAGLALDLPEEGSAMLRISPHP